MINRAGAARLCPERQDAVLSKMHQQLHCMKLVAEWQRFDRVLSPLAGRQDAVLGRVPQQLRFLCETRKEPVPHIGDVVSAGLDRRKAAAALRPAYLCSELPTYNLIMHRVATRSQRPYTDPSASGVRGRSSVHKLQP